MERRDQVTVLRAQGLTPKEIARRLGMRPAEVSALVQANAGVPYPDQNPTHAQTFATGTKPFCVAVADVNGDGRPDLVIANSGSRYVAGNVSVLLGNGNGTFKAQDTFTAGWAGPCSKPGFGHSRRVSSANA